MRTGSGCGAHSFSVGQDPASTVTTLRSVISVDLTPCVRRRRAFPTCELSGILVMQYRFEGRTAVIIGGTSGIGLASAHAFVMAGAQVVIAGRDP
jgi:hypothetical protein